MSSDPNGAWYTGDELKFIARIAARDDSEAFEGYRNSLSKRKDWGRIDRKQVVAEVKKQARRLKCGF